VRSIIVFDRDLELLSVSVRELPKLCDRVLLLPSPSFVPAYVPSFVPSISSFMIEFARDAFAFAVFGSLLKISTFFARNRKSREYRALRLEIEPWY
jgi:hypothetical protein